MKTTKLFGAAALALMTATTSAFADDLGTVQRFYDLLSNPGAEAETAAFLEATSADWISQGDYSGENKNRDAFLGQIGYFGQLIPDLNWAVEAMHQDGDFVTVRSRATGTPVGPMFGVDGEGRSFDILTIDIHQLENGQIVHTYHVEDWAGGLQQLSGQ